MAPWEDYLRCIYYDPSHPASYEGEKAVIMQLEEKENIKYLTSKLGNGFRIKMPIV